MTEPRIIQVQTWRDWVFSVAGDERARLTVLCETRGGSYRYAAPHRRRVRLREAMDTAGRALVGELADACRAAADHLAKLQAIAPLGDVRTLSLFSTRAAREKQAAEDSAIRERWRRKGWTGTQDKFRPFLPDGKAQVTIGVYAPSRTGYEPMPMPAVFRLGDDLPSVKTVRLAEEDWRWREPIDGRLAEAVQEVLEAVESEVTAEEHLCRVAAGVLLDAMEAP